MACLAKMVECAWWWWWWCAGGSAVLGLGEESENGGGEIENEGGTQIDPTFMYLVRDAP